MIQKNNIVIKVENLSKAYQLGQIGTGTISRDLERWYARIRGKDDPFLRIGESNDQQMKSESNVVWSLRDINFEIERGDAVGIIGRNGAGKSTLLKILSKVTAPTAGKVSGKGRIASLLEVGTGFHPELSGRENIFLNGAILGMRKKEIKRKLDEIVDFAGIERYLDTPVKRYSSGMYVRLAFAVAAHLESEILIVDEVLAVGDAEFQKKCLGKMGEVSKGEGRTVLFVSHNIGSILQLCNKGILLSNGSMIISESIHAVVNKYVATTYDNSFSVNIKRNNEAYITGIYICGLDGIFKTDFFHDEPIKICFKLEIITLDHPYSLFVMILDKYKRRVFGTECLLKNNKLEYELTINQNFLVRGQYTIHCFIHLPAIRQIDVHEDYTQFNILDKNSVMAIHGDYDYGNVFLNGIWS